MLGSIPLDSATWRSRIERFPRPPCYCGRLTIRYPKLATSWGGAFPIGGGPFGSTCKMFWPYTLSMVTLRKQCLLGSCIRVGTNLHNFEPITVVLPSNAELNQVYKRYQHWPLVVLASIASLSLNFSSLQRQHATRILLDIPLAYLVRSVGFNDMHDCGKASGWIPQKRVTETDVLVRR